LSERWKECDFLRGEVRQQRRLWRSTLRVDACLQSKNRLAISPPMASRGPSVLRTSNQR
jgi:hypothetical protein